MNISDKWQTDVRLQKKKRKKEGANTIDKWRSGVSSNWISVLTQNKEY